MSKQLEAKSLNNKLILTTKAKVNVIDEMCSI